MDNGNDMTVMDRAMVLAEYEALQMTIPELSTYARAWINQQWNALAETQPDLIHKRYEQLTKEGEI